MLRISSSQWPNTSYPLPVVMTLSPLLLYTCVHWHMMYSWENAFVLLFIQVQSTNDSSTLSKLSASNAGYFNDKNLKCFVNKPTRRAPLIHRWTYLFPVMVAMQLHCLRTMMCCCDYSCTKCGAHQCLNPFPRGHITCMYAYCFCYGLQVRTSIVYQRKFFLLIHVLFCYHFHACKTRSCIPHCFMLWYKSSYNLFTNRSPVR